jgi:hypothetical protein
MRTPYIALGIILLIGLFSCSVLAADKIQFMVGQYGFPGTTDTIFVGGHYDFRIFIENDLAILGIHLPFEIGSPQDLAWSWLAHPGGIGYSSHCITAIEESRLDGGAALDMTGLLATENFDSPYGDGFANLAVGGVAMLEGVEPGPLEHMISVHFRMDGSEPPLENGVVGVMCMDTACLPPCDHIGWIDMHGMTIFADIEGGCWPVKLLCGNPNGDNDVNVGDAVFMINYVFFDGPAPEPYWLGDANCDGEVDVGDVVFLIAAAFRYGPQPECCEYIE